MLPATSPHAVISPCGAYRYLLTRGVGPGDGLAAFIMFNPSTADARHDDPTIRRCIGFARSWGCGRLAVVNLFGYRSTDPTELKYVLDPVGTENRAWLEAVLDTSPRHLVCAWGAGACQGEDLRVRLRLAARGVSAEALGFTRSGAPRHPLYVPASRVPVPFPSPEPPGVSVVHP